ncbi:MAG: M23 family metallopeptidase [Nannocystis sp.]|nr:M23 family metallopeptidase [Nannocystis sp.]
MFDPRVIARVSVALLLACAPPATSTERRDDAPAVERARRPEDPRGALSGDPYDRLELTALRPRERVGWPVERVHITSFFGWRINPITGSGAKLHRGLDLRGQVGDLALAIADGVVTFAGHDPFLGNHVILDHGRGVSSYYGHLNDLLVFAGADVDRGAAIGVIGNTGRSEAPHLHLTVKIHEVPVDPLWLIGQPLHDYPALAEIAEPTQPAADP